MLNASRGAVSGRDGPVLGLAYKKNVDDSARAPRST